MRRPDERPSALISTSDLAEISGYSVQQIRDLENLGVIPPAARRPNGYRRFTDVHVVALRAYRNLAIAVGPVVARSTLREIRRLPFDDAVARVHALDAIVEESARDAQPAPEDTMSITELSAAIGVRSSTLRHWESEQLITPERTGPLTARRYPPNAVRDARIVSALRAGGHRIPAVRAVMTALHALGAAADAREALSARLASIAVRSDALLRAGADLSTLLRDGVNGVAENDS